jgi:hypothetical protein
MEVHHPLPHLCNTHLTDSNLFVGQCENNHSRQEEMTLEKALLNYDVEN